MDLFIGCPVKDRAWILPEWFAALEEQKVPHRVVCMVSKSEDETEKVLRDHGATVIIDPRPGRRVEEINGHVWGHPAHYAYMAELRNQLWKTVLSMGATHFLSIDSDILLPPGGLEALLDYGNRNMGIVAPAVDMSQYGGQPAWNTMTWPNRSRLATRPAQQPMKAGMVDVVMAAMLLDRSASAVRWAEHSQGEDIGFCVSAEANGVNRFWLPSVRCRHVMRPE